MNLNCAFGVGAIFKMQVRNGETNEVVRETAEFKNLVTTEGLNQMGRGTWIDRISVGTGNRTPSVNDVNLDQHLATDAVWQNRIQNGGGTQIDQVPYYWFGTCTWRFGIGKATGNIAEVGLGYDGGLWNRALVKDAEGNPTTITVLADEYLDVLIEIRVYPKDTTGGFRLIDKTGAVISEHTYKGTAWYGTDYGGAWISVMLQAAENGDNQYKQQFFVSDKAMPTGLRQTMADGATQFINGMGYSGVIAGQSFSRKITSTEGNFTTNQHRSFACGLYGLMCGGAFGRAERTSGFKWEVTPPIPKDTETILDYRWTVTLTDMGDI